MIPPQAVICCMISAGPHKTTYWQSWTGGKAIWRRSSSGWARRKSPASPRAPGNGLMVINSDSFVSNSVLPSLEPSRVFWIISRVNNSQNFSPLPRSVASSIAENNSLCWRRCVNYVRTIVDPSTLTWFPSALTWFMTDCRARINLIEWIFKCLKLSKPWESARSAKRHSLNS